MCLNGTFLNKKIIKGYAIPAVLIIFRINFLLILSAATHRSAFGLKIIKKLNKKIIKRLRPGTRSYNFLNKFSVNFERSDPKDNKISNFAPDNNKKKEIWT